MSLVKLFGPMRGALLILSSLLFMNQVSASLGHVPPVPAIPACDIDRPAQVIMPCGIIVIDQGDGLPGGASLSALLSSVGAKVRFNIPAAKAAALTVRNPRVLNDLLAVPGLQVIPDRPVHIMAKPTNPGKVSGGSDSQPTQSVPDGVNRIGAAPGSLSVTGSGVGVAIVDTGLDFSHGDLAVANACYDAFGGSCQDDHGHGTHVGGIVAALDNTQDVVGVASDATLYAVKVLDSAGSGNDSTIMAGLQWVINNAGQMSVPIRVVNMSLGRPGSLYDNPAMRSLVQTLKTKGIVVVVAAGNNAKVEVAQMVPATYPEVLAVASTTAINGANQCRNYSGLIAADTASYFTTDGRLNTNMIGVTISAPGAQKEDISQRCTVAAKGILSLKLGGGSTRMSGTSMAAPHVAGVIALLLAADSSIMAPEYIVDYVRSALRSSAARIASAPLNSPTTTYTFDGEREGVVSACGVLASC